ncbi:dTDP-4-dehydrorhamnose 3,5-epimerase [Niabella defluvii]|nr:dTDP-4-dehydrorhamnose 3,5-epimerase [Niabella sp. I65]
MVRALQGRILDVAVDIRKQSPTYGQVFSIELTADNKKQLLIPAGFAHGFSVLSETAVVMYKCDALYNKESEGGIIYNDPELAIDWQLPEGAAVVSDKDLILPSLKV